MKVWVFKKTVTPRPTSDNPNAKVVMPVMVIDGVEVEVYPTQPVDTGFFIEISNEPIPGHHNFYVSINQLHQLAYQADTQNVPRYALKSDDDIDTYLTQSSADSDDPMMKITSLASCYGLWRVIYYIALNNCYIH